MGLTHEKPNGLTFGVASSQCRFKSMDNGPDYFEDGLARSRVGGKIGYIDRKLNLVIPATYDGAYPFKDGVAVVCTACTIDYDRTVAEGERSWYEGGQWGRIDRRGRVVSPFRPREKISSGSNSTDTEPETFAPSRSAIALASSRVIFSSAPVNTTVLPATGVSVFGFSASRIVTCSTSRSTMLAVVALAEIVGDGLDHRVADLVERVHLGAASPRRLATTFSAASWNASRCRSRGRARPPWSRRHGGCRARR